MSAHTFATKPLPIQGHAMRWFAWWLMLVVVLVPVLSRIHAVAHPPTYVFATEQASAHLHGHEHESECSDIATLFAHHTSLDCATLDQLAYGHDLPVIDRFLPSIAPKHLPLWIPNLAVSVPLPRLFEARAPPSRFTA